MDRNVEVLLWIMIGDDKSNHDGLEQNGLQHNNTLWNVIGANASDWGGKELNGSQRKGFGMKDDGRWLPSSTQIIKYVDQALEALETVYSVHGAAVEGLEDWPEDVLLQWSVEVVSDVKAQNN